MVMHVLGWTSCSFQHNREGGGRGEQTGSILQFAEYVLWNKYTEPYDIDMDMDF